MFKVDGNPYSVCCVGGGFQVTDLSDPAAPVQVAYSDGGGLLKERLKGVTTFEVDGMPHAIMTSNREHLFLIVDLSIPSSPVVVSHAKNGEAEFELNRVHQGAIFDSNGVRHALVLAFNRFQIVNLADVSSPQVVSTCKADECGIDFSLYSASHASIFNVNGENYAFITTYSFDIPEANGFQIISLADLTSPIAVSRGVHGENGYTMYRAIETSIFEVNGVVYGLMACRYDSRIQIINIVNPASPYLVSQATLGVDGFDRILTPMSSSYFTLNEVLHVAIVSDGGNNAGFQVVNLADPSSPVAVASGKENVDGYTEMYGAGDIATFEVDGVIYAFVAAWHDNGFQIAKLSNRGAD